MWEYLRLTAPVANPVKDGRRNKWHTGPMLPIGDYAIYDGGKMIRLNGENGLSFEKGLAMAITAHGHTRVPTPWDLIEDSGYSKGAILETIVSENLVTVGQVARAIAIIDKEG